MRRRWGVAVLALGATIGLAGWAGAQGGVQASAVAADRSAFYPLSAFRAGERVAPEQLRRLVTVSMIQVPLTRALEEIGRQIGLSLSYGDAKVEGKWTVTAHMQGASALSAFERVLVGTPFGLLVSAHGQAVLVRGPAGPHSRAMRQAAGSIAGRVSDVKTGQAVPNATVIVEATSYRATAKDDGRYVIAGIVPGAYTVTARLLGHTPVAKHVEVRADSVARVDFALADAAATLEQVVTTAVGDQRRVEVGNDIATINADSVVKGAPITSLTDILSGRAPGVEVLESSGVLGSPVRIRIRGLSSLQLSNDPIVYVDGVRINSNPGGPNPTTISNTAGGSWPSPSRLNDLSPDEIASIDVLKGPSAATEYGTDAANGVIVVKTKRGQAGAPRWEFNTQQGLSDVATHEPAQWYGWGHTTDVSHTPVECPLTNVFGAPSVGAGTCVIDSVTTYQPLDHPRTSVLTTGRRQQYDAQVSGGGQQLRYFVAGSYGAETGVLHLDPDETRLLGAQGRSIASYTRTPNVTDGTNLRGRFTMPVGSAADVALSTGYISNYQRSADEVDLGQEAEFGPGYRDAVGDGYWSLFPPRYLFQNSVSDGVSRFTGGLTANWHPATWLVTHGTVGLDDANQTDLAFRLPGLDPTDFTFPLGALGSGYRSNQQLNTHYYTADVGATVSLPIARGIGSKTSAGVQYNDSRQSGTLLTAYGIGVNNSLTGAAISVPAEIGDQTRTLGSYLEETVEWYDRLFITGAVRVDAGSGFGKQVNSAAYPKASASLVLVDAPGQSLRLRAAYGQSGVQPKSGATLSLYSPAPAIVAGATVTGDTAVSLSNPSLKPERQREFEGGVDASVLGRRVDVQLTYYTKLSRDALVNVTLPYSLGVLTQQQNVGSVRNYGLEGTAALHVLDVNLVQWDISVGGSVNQNRLVSLEPGARPIVGGFGLGYRNAPGYPLYGYWAPRLRYADLNHDHIIEPKEVSETDSSQYVGSSIPTRELTLSTGVGLWGGRVRLAGQLDHRGGFRLENYAAATDAFFLGARDLNDPHLPLWRQARAVEGGIAFSPINDAYFEDASFTRLRELSVRYLLPDGLARALRGRTASIGVSGRNLALWTHYTGADPEVTNVGFFHGPLDAAVDGWSLPQLRRWVLRVDVGF